ncbi:MAG: hypothetical protein ACO4B5_12830 [Steroidobacteraceae bacterium]
MSEPYQALDNSDATPFEMLLRRSQGIDLARQYLPRALGGYGKEKLRDLDAMRAASPEKREKSLRVGDYPVLDDAASVPQGPAPEAARRAAQAAGVLAKDVTTQGWQNIWWFINAFEAAAMAAGQQANHGALKGIASGRYQGSPFTRSDLKVAAAFPLVLGAGAATGTLFRQPGYTAVLPSEEDRTETSDPVGERFMRAIGRTGTLLPYDEFVRERPDVSRGEYEQYKAFLFGDKSPVKFTGEGIHGPEVNFLGKSIPLLTGLAPVAGGIIGGRMGLRFAGKRLANGRDGVDQFKTLEARSNEVQRIRSELYRGDVSDEARDILETQLQGAIKNREDQLNLVEGRLLGGSIAGSAAGLSLTAAGASLLEQIRRAQNLEENRREAALAPATAGTAGLPG